MTDAANADQLAELLRKDADELIRRWVELAAASLRGRMSEAELDREFREFFRILLDAVDTGSRDTNDDAYAEVRVVLEELSRGRARLGFSPTETAVGVFALKSAVFELIEQQDSDRFRDVIAFSQLLDQ
ncbi:MAG: RsbRD N-terminal domain-containing protein, partial [Kibdelosporangium sp.]